MSKPLPPHDTWIVAPKLYAELETARAITKPPAIVHLMSGITISPDPYIGDDVIALMYKGKFVTLVYIERGEATCH